MISIMPRNKKKLPDFLAFCLGIALILLLIQAGGSLHGNRIVFPEIREIGEAFIRLVSDAGTYTMIGVTMLHLLEALAWALCIGLLTGLAEGISSFIRAGLKPLMILIRSLPMIILVILMMILFPYDHVPVVSGALVLIPVISEAVCEGCRALDPELKDVYRLNSGFNLRVLFGVYIPLISGYLKQAFFNAAGMGLKVVVSAEYLVQTKKSLGKAVYSSSYFLEYADIYAYALIMILLVVLTTEVPMMIIRLRERKAGRRNADR